MNVVIISAILMFLSTCASAELCNRHDDDSADLLKPYEFCDDDFVNKKTPKFNDFPVESSEKLKAKFPTKIDGYGNDLDDKLEEQKWFDSIQLTYKNEGANFAGHYLIAERDCGSSCHLSTIVDLITGQTYRPIPVALVIASINPLNESLCVKLGFKCNDSVFGFKQDSNLIIVMGSLGEETKKRGFYFYQWKNNQLKLITKIEKTYKK